MPKTSIWDFVKDPESQRAVKQGLLDSFNRGAIGNTLGAPVDIATNALNLLIAGGGYVGHKAGLLSTPPDLIEPKNALGSSEWIGQKLQDNGVVTPNRNALAEMGMGLLAPVAYKGVNKLAGLLYDAEQAARANYAKPSTMAMQGQRGAVAVGNDGVRLYHGTDQEFDGLPKPAYGGVYYAENPSVAEMYSSMRSGQASVKTAKLSSKARVFDATKPGSEKVLARIERDYDNATDYIDPEDGQYMPLSDWVRSGYLFKLGRKAQNEVMESLRAEGFDAVRYKDASPMTGDSISWVIFDNSQLAP